MKHAFFLHTLAIVFIGSFFIHSNVFAAASTEQPPGLAVSKIVINEIGAYESVGLEWIEIYNAGDSAVDLSGWSFFENETDHGMALAQGLSVSLPANGFAIITQDAEKFLTAYPFASTTVFDSAWASLKESGELIGLKDAAGILIEQFTYIAAPDYSLERIDAAALEYSAANWKEHPGNNSVGLINYWALGHENPGPGPKGVKTLGPGQEALKHENSENESEGIQVPVETEPVQNGGGENNEPIESVPGNQSPETYPMIILSEFLSDPAEGPEWIELYNPTPTSTDMAGWMLADAVGTIAAPTSTIGGYGFVVIELANPKLNNGGDALTLITPNGAVSDTISYGEANEPLPAPKKGNTIARDALLLWKETVTPTKGGINIITLPTPSLPSENKKSDSPPIDKQEALAAEKKQTQSPAAFEKPASGSSLLSYQKGILLINEIVSDPADDEEEFIELFNPSANTIPLAGWMIEDGSEKETVLQETIGPKQFFIIEKPNGNLNNAGDIIVLRDPAGNIIDQVTYGSWDDGNTADNAPSADDPFSLSRIGESQDTDYDALDFRVTMTATKGKKNIISQKNDLESMAESSAIIISELYPNPPGSDLLDEFIELKNIGETAIDIAGWELGDTGKRRYRITQGFMKPGEYFVFKRSQTNIALNNTGNETVFLFDKNGNEMSVFSYSGKTEEGVSYIKEKGGKIDMTSTPTPGALNIVKKQNNPPILVIDAATHAAVAEPIVIDASDTTDPDGDPLTFAWQLNGTPVAAKEVMEYRFAIPGIYTVSLSVDDGQGAVLGQDVRIVIGEYAEENMKNEPIFAGGFYPDELQFIQFSELLPNPEGRDDAEFIELYNPIDIPLPLGGLLLDDEEEGSRPYVIPDGTVIEPRSFMLFEREETGIALNNAKDAARLLYPDESIVTAILYDAALVGASYIINDIGAWMWTSEPTPGHANVIAPIEEASLPRQKKDASGSLAAETALGKLGDEDIGDAVSVTGTVVAIPNTFAAQYCYITDGNAGVQIYLHTKNFPTLAIGDRVTVVGAISEFQGALRIKIKKKEDIVVTGHGDLPPPNVFAIADLAPSGAGTLIAITGEITERTASYLYLDDGTEEIKIYIKKTTGIDVKSFQKGNTLAVAGILVESNNELRLLPRSKEDITIIKSLIETAAVPETQYETTTKPSTRKRYIAIAAGGCVAILLGFLIKVRSADIIRCAARFKKTVIGVLRKKE